ncbi:MAG: regulatory protein RecX [Bradymonadia bacterium]
MKTYRKPKPLTYQQVERMAVSYLQRFPASIERFREVMARKIKRYEARSETVVATALEWVAKAESFCLRVGLLDDKALAKGLVQSYHRRGDGLAAIRMKLIRKGIRSPELDEAVAMLTEKYESTGTSVELVAAVRYLRRRRFGPFYDGELDWHTRRKQVASLARRRLPADVCWTAIKLTRDEADAILYEAQQNA